MKEKKYIKKWWRSFSYINELEIYNTEKLNSTRSERKAILLKPVKQVEINYLVNDLLKQNKYFIIFMVDIFSVHCLDTVVVDIISELVQKKCSR